MAVDNLTPPAIEELEQLVKQVNAVACLINADESIDDTARDAAGSMLVCLSKARGILEGQSHG